ncbi:MAG: phage integrase N-terminal SAM-like domain-containing protein [Kangiellaceae bacterium]|nr:phage integrase N-terminal SAM-like domain-containing protein [Kangiellaceae bacterium]
MEGKQQLFDKLIAAFKHHKFKRTDAQIYLNWVKLFLKHNDTIDPKLLDHDSVKQFLSYLCDSKGMMPSKQKEAYLALDFFYKQVLQRNLWASVDLGNLVDYDSIDFNSKEDVEVEQEPEWTKRLQEPYRLIAQVMFKSGLKLEEVLNLRVEDVDVTTRSLRVRDAFGDLSRIEIADKLFEPLALQVKKSLQVFNQDMRSGGNVWFKTPRPLDNNKLTNNSRWFFLFPGTLQYNLNIQKRLRLPLKIETVHQAFNDAKKSLNDQFKELNQSFESKVQRFS